MSRKCQHDKSRNCQLGRLSACPVACLCAAAMGIPGARRGRFAALNRRRASARSAGSIGDLVEGTGPPDFGFRAPGMGPAGGISGHGARRRRTDADRVGSRPAGRRRPPRLRFAMTTRTPQVSAPGRSGSRRLTAGEMRNSICSVPAGSVRRHPDYEDPRRPPTASASAPGRPYCEPGPATAALAGGASRAGPRHRGCQPAQDRGGKAWPVSPPPGASRPAAGASPVR